MATVTEAGRLTSVSDFKVIWCFVHVCVGVNKTFYKLLRFLYYTKYTTMANFSVTRENNPMILRMICFRQRLCNYIIFLSFLTCMILYKHFTNMNAQS